jgi:hypothetical protein
MDEICQNVSMCTELGRGSSGLHNSREACGAGARNSHLECEGSSFVNDSLHVCLVKSGPLTPLPLSLLSQWSPNLCRFVFEFSYQCDFIIYSLFYLIKEQKHRKVFLLARDIYNQNRSWKTPLWLSCF